MKPRHGLLAAALALTLAAVWQGSETDAPAIFDGARREDAPPALVGANPLPAPRLAPAQPKLAAGRMGTSRIDLFAPRDWRPPPPVEAAVEPPKPRMPPLPYRYIGRWEETGSLTLFFSRDGRPTPIHAGQVLDGEWRVDRITPQRVEFTYLPLETRAVMALENPS
jgi:hypothetical protein